MMDHLYLSDQRSKVDIDKFSLVIDMDYPQNGMELNKIKDEYKNNTRIIHIGADDSEDQDMSTILDYILPVINQYVKASQKVLIYSHEGFGRNIMVLSSYLIRNYGFKLKDLSHVFQTSGMIQRLNPYFMYQLELMAEK
jgi:protein-tyrosine phosphatase